MHKSWRSGDENAIFRDFIERERNSILKEYESEITVGRCRSWPICSSMMDLMSSGSFCLKRIYIGQWGDYRSIRRRRRSYTFGRSDSLVGAAT